MSKYNYELLRVRRELRELSYQLQDNKVKSNSKLWSKYYSLIAREIELTGILYG